MFCGDYIIQDEHGSFFTNMNLHHYTDTTQRSLLNDRNPTNSFEYMSFLSGCSLTTKSFSNKPDKLRVKSIKIVEFYFTEGGQLELEFVEFANSRFSEAFISPSCWVPVYPKTRKKEAAANATASCV